MQKTVISIDVMKTDKNNKAVYPLETARAVIIDSMASNITYAISINLLFFMPLS
jgi:hypothetical protein